MPDLVSPPPAEDTATATYRLPRVELLKAALDGYVSKELSKIQADAAALRTILQGRTGSQAIQTPTVRVVSVVAQRDLIEYLKGE